MDVVQPEKSALRREEIVEAAVALADAEGLDAVSMRKLAERLGVATMTPYSHVAGKDELLDLMRDRVALEMLAPEPLPVGWRAALRAIALRTRDAIEAHPWVLDAQAHSPRLRINLTRHIEQSLSVVEMMGIEPEQGGAVLMAIDDYVVGHCIRHRARQRAARAMRAAQAAGEPRPELDPAVKAAFETGELDLLKRAFGSHRRQPSRFGLPPEADFEQGLEWMLDGIEAMAA
ncbi:MAG TPA: TetR/AcrR family transcriptional regulator C-terminal domain-containing protein [Solirubrobacterales bacterium]|nr:TetR/AcrR family transcriptional regulator C-terminal domain-containing protein [Solirubrobacterales bacterium]